MKNFCPHLFLLVPLLLWNASADHSTEPDHDFNNLLCDLECHNNGFCRFFSKHEYELKSRMQSGRMVQECLCPLGYRGMSCDVSVEDDPKDCTGLDAASPRCECAAADRLSVFAGEQCRKPSTEFCASLDDSVGGHISYCTNGGKCKGDLIAAERSPGNTDNNYLFQHAGCLCPPEFKGEHCELLNKDFRETHHTKKQKGVSSKKGAISLLVVCVGGLAAMALILIRKVRRNRSALHALPKLPVALNRYRDDDWEESYDENLRRSLPHLA